MREVKQVEICPWTLLLPRCHTFSPTPSMATHILFSPSHHSDASFLFPSNNLPKLRSGAGNTAMTLMSVSQPGPIPDCPTTIKDLDTPIVRFLDAMHETDPRREVCSSNSRFVWRCEVLQRLRYHPNLACTLCHCAPVTAVDADLLHPSKLGYAASIP